jgi:hypothetical protein
VPEATGAATRLRWTPGRAASGNTAPMAGPCRAAAKGGAARGHRGHPSRNANSEAKAAPWNAGGARRGGKAQHVNARRR